MVYTCEIINAKILIIILSDLIQNGTKFALIGFKSKWYEICVRVDSKRQKVYTYLVTLELGISNQCEYNDCSLTS